MFITVLGSSGCRYDYGNDTASFLINNKVIVDTGWNLVENILGAGLNPADFRTILFTHFHHDHYIALPQFLFYYICAGKPLSELALIGPPDIDNILKLAMDFLQVSKFYEDAGCPKCVVINPGESIELDEERLLIEAHKSLHPVDGRFYCVTDIITEEKLGLSGDTAYDPAEILFFRGCDMIVHECSLGAKHTGENLYLHSDAEDAAAVAAGAGAKTLVLAHYPANLREECRNAAANKFGGIVLTPVKGDVISVI